MIKTAVFPRVKISDEINNEMAKHLFLHGRKQWLATQQITVVGLLDNGYNQHYVIDDFLAGVESVNTSMLLCTQSTLMVTEQLHWNRGWVKGLAQGHYSGGG